MNILNLLISKGSSIHFKSIEKITCLMLACIKGNTNILNILLNKKADVNEQDIRLNTALHYACSNNNVESVKILIIHPDINLYLTN